MTHILLINVAVPTYVKQRSSQINEMYIYVMATDKLLLFGTRLTYGLDTVYSGFSAPFLHSVVHNKI